MGYYTDYELTCTPYEMNINGLVDMNTVKEWLTKDIYNLGVFEGGSVEDGFRGFAKWYNYEKDMIEISKKYHGVLFHLKGDGENKEDMWDEYFLDGATQYGNAVIIREEFDPTKLIT